MDLRQILRRIHDREHPINYVPKVRTFLLLTRLPRTSSPFAVFDDNHNTKNFERGKSCEATFDYCCGWYELLLVEDYP
jgi:hypothetical protein